jgi:hypothetical protein
MTRPWMAAALTGPKWRLSVLADALSPSTETSVPATPATRLTMTRAGSRGSTTATRSPTLAGGLNGPSPRHTSTRSPGRSVGAMLSPATRRRPSGKWFRPIRGG